MSKYIERIVEISLVLFLILNYFLFIKDDVFNVRQTFREMSISDSEIVEFKEYYLEFNNNVNSKNFEKIFSKFENLEYEIRKIYPIVSSNYNEELTRNLSEYSFDNIKNFIAYYINNLKKYNLDEDINNVNVYGVKIDKILIYTTKDNIEEISSSIEASSYKNKEM